MIVSWVQLVEPPPQRKLISLPHQPSPAKSSLSRHGGPMSPPQPCWNFGWPDLVQFLCKQLHLLWVGCVREWLPAQKAAFLSSPLHPPAFSSVFQGVHWATNGDRGSICGRASSPWLQALWLLTVAFTTNKQLQAETSLSQVESSTHLASPHDS